MITIATISYNQAQYLREAVESVIDQRRSGVSIEYIVVDAGSTDGSRELLVEFGDSIDRLVFESDDGPADGLRKAFGFAHGSVLGFLNADDFLLPGALVAARTAFEADSEMGVYLSRGLRFDERSGQLSLIQPSTFSRYRFACGAATFCQPSSFFRASAYRAAGGVNPRNRASWDGELFLRMFDAGASFRVHPQISSVFRVHDASISGSNSLSAVYHEELRELAVETLGRVPTIAERLAMRFLGVGERSCRAAVQMFPGVPC